MNEEQLFQIFIEFGATFLGAILAFSLALWDDRRKRHMDEIRTKIRILIAIIEELDLNLVTKIDTELGMTSLPPIPIITNALDSSVGGGHFSLLDSNTQKRISRIYSLFQNVEVNANKLISLKGTIEYEFKVYEEIVQLIAKFMQKIEEDLPKLKTYLENTIAEYEAQLR